MGRLETSGTAAARKSCLAPTTSRKSTPTLGLPERRLLFEFQQNQEDSLLRLAHLLKANSDHLRDMLQWTTTEFNERLSTRNQTRIPRMSSVMPAETALRVGLGHFSYLHPLPEPPNTQGTEPTTTYGRICSHSILLFSVCAFLAMIRR